MKLATLTSVTLFSICLLCAGIYILLTAGDLQTSSTIISAQAVLVTIVIASSACLFGLYKKKAWSLYVFLSLCFFMLVVILAERFNANNTLLVADAFLIAAFLLITAFLCRVLFVYKGGELFTLDK